MTFGDVRRIIIDTVIKVRNGDMGTSQGMTIAALMKSLTDNVQVEINAAKLAIQTEDKANNFGRVVGMGQRLIGNGSGQDS
jgi:hypothetical protein